MPSISAHRVLSEQKRWYLSPASTNKWSPSCKILALGNEELAVKLQEDRIAKAKKVEMDSSEIETIINL